MNVCVFLRCPSLTNERMDVVCVCVRSSCLFDLSLGIVSEGSHDEQITSDCSPPWHDSAALPSPDIEVQ